MQRELFQVVAELRWIRRRALAHLEASPELGLEGAVRLAVEEQVDAEEDCWEFRCWLRSHGRLGDWTCPL